MNINLMKLFFLNLTIVFYKYTHTLTTTLVTKDRVLAHNPVGALYLLPWLIASTNSSHLRWYLSLRFWQMPYAVISY